MVTELSKTGIGIVGDVPWGTHFCHFYETKEDLLDMLIPYFKAGLENNEFCMWIVYDPLDVEEARNALKGASTEAERHLEAGDIEIVPHTQWYLKGGVFDLQRIIDGWENKLTQAVEKGYAGMRVNGNEGWLTEKDWKNFAAYEKKRSELIADKRMIVLCSYPLTVTKAAELFDVARTHEFVIAKRHGNWEFLETQELKQTKADLKRLNEDVEQRVRERTRGLEATNEELGREITKRDRIERALKKSEAELRTLFAAMTEVVLVLDAEGRYLKIAPTNPLNLYRPSEELLGKRIHEVLPKEDADKILRQIRRALEARQTVHFEYKLKIESREVWFDGKVSPLTENTVFWIARDITQRKQAETALKASEEQYRQVIEQINEVLFSLDQNGILTFMSSVVRTVAGYEPEDLIGHPFTDFIYPDDLPDLVKEFKKRMKGKKEPIEYRIRAKSGESMWVRSSSRALFEGGEFKGIRGVLTDVTEQRNAKEAARKLEEQLRQSQKLEAIGTLASGVAHDFNNLLTIILGNADLMLMDLREDHPYYRPLEETKKAANRAASLTRQLLAFSRKQVIEPKILDLNEIIHNTHKMLARLIGEHIRLETNLAPDLWPVEADPGQMEQVIMNLAVNARDAMPEGGHLTLRTQNRDMDEFFFKEKGVAGGPGSYAVLRVTDTGTGMSTEIMERIFEPFFTTKGMGKGTGLGLSTVYGIVKQNRGFIFVQSEPGAGTTFEILLPRVEGRKSDDAREISPQAKPLGSETILVVEDNKDVRAIALATLNRYGYHVLEAPDGESALNLIRSYKGPVHLLITDVIMPGMGGNQLAGQVRVLRPNTKVLFMSGYTDESISRYGVLKPGLALLSKPFTPEALAKKVREVLDTRPPPTPPSMED
jgi:PAS domain S-box-containing protein